jgi:hypothetical protein
MYGSVMVNEEMNFRDLFVCHLPLTIVEKGTTNLDEQSIHCILHGMPDIFLSILLLGIIIKLA